VSVTITGMESLERLDQALGVARDFTPLSLPEQKALLARTAAASGEGKHEKYKTSGQFDGTAQHPEWLGPS
jgi:hypothetical protein